MFNTDCVNLSFIFGMQFQKQVGGQEKNKCGVHLQEESDTTQVRVFLGV